MSLSIENPIAEEGDYRVEALVILPNLKMLDEEPYEDEEREEAAEVRQPLRSRRDPNSETDRQR